MDNWQVIREIFTDHSTGWNVEGRIDENEVDVPRKLRIGCIGKRQAQALARQLNDASYVNLLD